MLRWISWLVLGLLEGSMATASDLPRFDELWNHGDPAGTRATFEELLPRARASEDPGYLAQLLTQIARTHGLSQAFDRAHEVLDEVDAMLSDATPVAAIRADLERGRVFNSSGRADEARPHFLRAFVQAHKQGEDGFAVDAVHMLAIVATPEDAIQWNELAIDLAERSDRADATRWLGSLYNNIGWSHHDRGSYETAIDFWTRNIAWQEERDRREGAWIARWCVARGLRSLEHHEEALARQHALLDEYAAAGVEEEGYCAEEIAENLLALGKPDEARPWFAKAHAKLSKDPWLQRNESDRLTRLATLAAE